MSSTSWWRSSTPRGLRMSSVTLFLLVFRPEKIGERSHHWSSVTGTPAINRVPSGRAVDSTWITSAPSCASTCVHDGPAQKLVMSRTRIPSNGNPRRNRIPGRDLAGFTTLASHLRAVVVGVFTEPRGRLRCARQRRGGAIGRAGLGEPVAWIGHERAALDELVERGDVGAVSDRRVGNPERGTTGQGCRRRCSRAPTRRSARRGCWPVR